MAEKAIRVFSKSTPDQVGWNDWVEVWQEGQKIWEGPGSANPSPYDYKARDLDVNNGTFTKDEDYTWDKRGGWIAPGTYNWTKSYWDRLRDMDLDLDQEIPSRKPNPRNGNRPVVAGALVHQGFNGDDKYSSRGSEGCITIHPDHWQGFKDVFRDGDKGQLEVIDAGGGKPKAESAGQSKPQAPAPQPLDIREEAGQRGPTQLYAPQSTYIDPREYKGLQGDGSLPASASPDDHPADDYILHTIFS